MSKADRTIRNIVGSNRTFGQLPEEENTSILPKIDNKKPLANATESYNFVNTKKNSQTKDSMGGILNKEALSSLNQQERSLVEELARKIEEQRREIDQRNQTLMAIQRNFETMSVMLKKEKELGAENKRLVSVLTEDNNKLAEENRVLVKRVDDMIERLNKYEREIDSNAKDKKKLNQLLEEQAALKERIQELVREIEKRKKDVNDLDAKNKSLLSQIEKLKNNSQGFEEERQKYLTQIKEAKNEVAIIQNENDKLQKVIIEFKIKLGDFDKLKEDYQNLLVKKAEVDKENREYIEEVSALRNEIKALRDHIKKLEDGFQSQNLQLKVGGGREDSLRDEIKELKKLLEIRDNEIYEANSKIGELKKNLQEEIQYIKKYKSLIEKYEMMMSKDGAEVTLIKKFELDKLNNDFDHLKEKTADYEELKKKIEKLTREVEKKNEIIEQYLAEKRQEEEKSAKLYERIKSLEEENKKLATHNQKLISALDFKNESEKDKDQRLSAEIESLKQKLQENITNLEDISVKYKNVSSEKDALVRQVDMMKREIDNKNRENETLRKKIDSLEAEKNMKSSESDQYIRKLKQELENMRNQYRTLQETTDNTISGLTKQNEEFKVLNKKKDEEIQELKSKLEGLTLEGKSTQKSLHQLESEVRDLKNTIDLKENQIEILKKTNSSLSDDLASKIRESQDYAQRLKELNEKIRILTEKNDDLTIKNRDVNTALKELSNDFTLARLRLKQTESNLESLEVNYKEVLKKLAALDEAKFKERLASFEDKEKQFNKVIAKIDHAQSSLLISLSCCECMTHLKNPVTLIPCGHNYCQKCVPKNNVCKECGGDEVDYTFRNKILEDVIAKVSYNQVILESLKPDDMK